MSVDRAVAVAGRFIKLDAGNNLAFDPFVQAVVAQYPLLTSDTHSRPYVQR